MSIITGDIKFYLTGGAANSDVNASLGGTTSSVQITTATLNNLFDNISASEAINGDSEYRAIAIKNTNGSDTLYNAKLFCAGYSEGSDDTHTEFALDSGTQTIADESTVPSNPTLTFTTNITENNALSLGDMAPGAEKRIWIKRVCGSNAVAYSADKQTLTVKGQTT